MSTASELVDDAGYCTREVADGWFSARHIGDWEQGDEQARDGALVRAADWLDGQFRFRGERVDAAQPRAWPRRYIGNSDDIEGPVLPPPVLQAYLELALAFLDGESEAEAMLGLTGQIIGEKVAGVAVTYSQPRTGLRRKGSRIDALLAPFLKSQSATKVVRL